VSAGFSGADVQGLRDLATAFQDASDRLLRGRVSVGNQIQISAWVGPFATKFRLAWDSEHSLRVAGVASELARYADLLRSNADEQAAASAAGGGSTASAWPTANGSKSSGSAPPSNVDEMFKALHGMDKDDGIRIQKVVGVDGTIRYIVYINGTGTADNKWLLSGPENLLTSTGHLGPTDLYLDALLKAKIRPRDAEVMLVGFSQGGMHAEMLAQSGEYKVTDVITLNSPTIPQVNNVHGANIVRIQDPGQEPWQYAGRPSELIGHATGGLRDIVGGLTGDAKGIQKTFNGTTYLSHDGGFLASHSNEMAHSEMAQQFDASTDSQDLAFKAHITRYQTGTVTEIPTDDVLAGDPSSAGTIA